MDPLVGLVIEGWAEVDRVLDGLTDEDAIRQVDGGSSFAWTLGHLSGQLDTWINVRQQGLPQHPVFGNAALRFGGTGVADNWAEIRAATAEVRDRARPYLTRLMDNDLAGETLYIGSHPSLAGRNVTLRYILLRIAAHTYFHIGDIAAMRSRRLGHSVGDYPGPLLACL